MAFRHIFISHREVPVEYKSRKGFGVALPVRDDLCRHAQKLLRKFNTAFPEHAGPPTVTFGRAGAFVNFTLGNEYLELAGSLAREKSGIQLRNVHRGESVFSATVFMPVEKRGLFVSRLEKFLAQLEEGRQKPHGAALFSGIEDIRAAVVESFWQDEQSLMPQFGGAAVWCEVWLQRNSVGSEVSDFTDAAEHLGIELREGDLKFPERRVVLCRATRAQLADLIGCCSDIAEFRRFRKTSRHYIEMHPLEQSMRARQLDARTVVENLNNVSVCVLDTGANNGHLLLRKLLDDDVCIASNALWTTDDWKGHGTGMCGMAAYGDLSVALQFTLPVRIPFCLESVKILPAEGNPPNLYGAVTADGVSRIEIIQPSRLRVLCMAVSEDDPNLKANGVPSSWSAAIDQLAYGSDSNDQRLFLIAAGNADWRGITSGLYASWNLTKPVENPGQSWNALTVGAITEKVSITNSSLAGYLPLARSGELSPHSATSVGWDKQWPIKPDIVMEGGNMLVAPDGSVDALEDVSMLSLSRDPASRIFECFDGTSAATALASKLAAELRAEYPEAWPETIRGLMVHSARWPDSIVAQFCQGARVPTKTQCQNLVRICGYGVPDRKRALYCKQSALTMIVQGELQPYKLEGRVGKMNQMHLIEMPWPKEVLMGLRDLEVKMRVTLSYFIEPSPGERGWLGKYRYASHGLRFAVNGPQQTREDFLRKVNNAIERAENDDVPGLDSARWTIGRRNDTAGSIHSDFMEEPAEDIAQCNLIAIYPIIGWWRERPGLRKVESTARYSLIVSLETPEESADIYTPVSLQVGVPIPEEIQIS